MKIDLEIQVPLYGDYKAKLIVRGIDGSDFEDELKKIHKLEEQVRSEFAPKGSHQ